MGRNGQNYGTLKWAHWSNQSVFGMHNIWETTENWENEAISSGLVTWRLYFKKKDIKRPFFPPSTNWPICICYHLSVFRPLLPESEVVPWTRENLSPRNHYGATWNTDDISWALMELLRLNKKPLQSHVDYGHFMNVGKCTYKDIFLYIWEAKSGLST